MNLNPTSVLTSIGGFVSSVATPLSSLHDAASVSANAWATEAKANALASSQLNAETREDTQAKDRVIAIAKAKAQLAEAKVEAAINMQVAAAYQNQVQSIAELDISSIGYGKVTKRDIVGLLGVKPSNPDPETADTEQSTVQSDAEFFASLVK